MGRARAAMPAMAPLVVMQRLACQGLHLESTSEDSGIVWIISAIKRSYESTLVMEVYVCNLTPYASSFLYVFLSDKSEFVQFHGI